MRGIKNRWISNSLGIVVGVLFVVIAFFSIYISNYYYTNVLSSLEQRAQGTARFFNSYLNLSYTDYYTSAYQYAERFDEKNHLEMQFINSSGRVDVSTSGLVAGSTPNTPDINGALRGGTLSSWIGIDQTTGERVMGVSAPLLFSNNQVIGAVRYVTSLKLIDRQVFILILFAFSVGLLIILLVILSNLYFVRSIVNPVREMNKIAKLIAAGSYGVTIDKEFNDEIGELCDTINNLSLEIRNAEKMKNDFVSSVSHEIRTPLTAISGWGETLLYMDDPVEMKKGVEIIMKEAKRLMKLVEDLLEFTMLDSGRIKMRMERIDISTDFEEVVYMYMDSLRKEGIVLNYSFEDDIPEITGDRGRLKQVFFNLIDNAAKHGGSGGEIDTSISYDKEYVIIRIRDYGPGIPEEDLTFIKQKFYKGSSQSRGSGIGLAIANEVVLAHNGQIVIENAPDTGTVVTVRLPIKINA
ncbi:MAG: sensor histidine kinase [Eubacteriales bacterium]